MKPSYKTMEQAPVSHRIALVHLANGRSDEDVASVMGWTLTTVKNLREHPPIKEALARIAERVDMMVQSTLFMQHECVDLSIKLQHAALREAIQMDDDGSPVLRMVTNSKGDLVPALPASTLNKLLEVPLDRDPAGRFAKKSKLPSQSSAAGVGGALLESIKASSALAGFSPPKTLDANFEVVRDGSPVLDASSEQEVELSD